MSLPNQSDIDTGVTNGDVDWLFRGKSKKLTKKLTADIRTHEAKTKSNESDKSDKSDKPEKSDKSEKDELRDPSSPKSDPKPSESSTSGDTKRNPPPSYNPSVPSGPSVSSANGPSVPSGQARLRSLSALKVDSSSTSSSSKRRSSFSFMNIGSNNQDDPKQSSTPQSSNPPSRSNSGKGRSFFSSLSLKLKGSSNSSSNASPNLSPHTSNTKTLAQQNHHLLNQVRSQIQSPSFNPHSQFNHGLFGPAGQDLSACFDRPPAEGGISIAQAKSARRPSFSSSPKLSLESEKGGFFRRRSLQLEASPLQVIHDQPRVVLNKNPNKTKPMKEFENSNLKRVAFSLDKLQDDPQQQIPLRRPKKGNVLVPEDITAPTPRLSQGISVSDGKGNRTAATELKYSENDLQTAVEAQKKALVESDKHALEAHLSAKKLACQIASFKLSGGKNNHPDEDEVDVEAEKIEIDKPLHVHENHFEAEDEAEHIVQTDPASGSENISLEAVYSRCCHLREILPIPATLRQLKSKSSPLQVLKLLNPKPTLIDVLSFSDFIAITPIDTVIFDNVTMTTEMLRHLLAALVHNKALQKLSLRNVAIDEDGWLYLCEFLGTNLTVKKLDISQQRIKHVTKTTSVRSAMNWSLFIKSIIARGGIEELVMGGCKLSDEVFHQLVNTALMISTCRLGVAATELNVAKCAIIADWISKPDTRCIGIDIAYNDMNNGQLRPFIDAFSTGKVKLVFFSLNSTNLTNIEEVGELLKALVHVETLRFLDLSSLPQLFPGVVSKLSRFLPLFPNLRRIHFDLNELSSPSIAAIADILPKIKTLVHVSLLGNRNLNRTCIGSLYTAVKMSQIFNLDLDYDLVPDELSQRLALYLMRNMDRQIRPDITSIGGDAMQDDLMFDGSLLMETAEKMLVESDKNSDSSDPKLQKLITNALIERTNAIRVDIHKIIDSLFQQGIENLPFEKKELLLRFCLLDSSLERFHNLFEQKAKEFKRGGLSPAYSKLDASAKDAIPQSVGNGNNDGERGQLHETSKALIDAGPILMAKTRPVGPVGAANQAGNADQGFQPHSVVVEAGSDGRKVPIDNTTGRPLLFKSMSQTSLHAKEQELEEGEFHRWGYFMEHREDPDDKTNNEKVVVGSVPSGNELREAIIDAKGIDSVTELIKKINNNRVSLDKIYSGQMAEESKDTEEFHDASDRKDESDDDRYSIDSDGAGEVHPVVDEAYDKLLSEAQRVRSNR